MPKVFDPGEELEGELEPKPGLDPKLEEDPDPKVEFVPPPRRAPLALSCSMRGS